MTTSRAFLRLSFNAPETTWFSSTRSAALGATVQRMCNGGALYLKALKGLGKLTGATVQR